MTNLQFDFFRRPGNAFRRMNKKVPCEAAQLAAMLHCFWVNNPSDRRIGGGLGALQKLLESLESK